MTKYIGQCDRCKKEFRAKPRNKLVMMREQPKNGHFVTYRFARYYCEECAQEVMKAVRRYEMGGAL